MPNYDIFIDRHAGVRNGDRLMRVQIGGALLRWCLENPTGSESPSIPAPPDIGVVGALGMTAATPITPDWASLDSEMDDALVTCFVADAAGTSADPVPTLAEIAAILSA